MTRLVRKVKLVMVMGNVYVNMVTKDKHAVRVLMDFTSKGLIIFSLHAQVSLLCSGFFWFYCNYCQIYCTDKYKPLLHCACSQNILFLFWLLLARTFFFFFWLLLTNIQLTALLAACQVNKKIKSSLVHENLSSF